MARYLIDTNAQTADDVLGFDLDGYRYSEEHTNKPCYSCVCALIILTKLTNHKAKEQELVETVFHSRLLQVSSPYRMVLTNACTLWLPFASKCLIKAEPIIAPWLWATAD